MNYSYFDQLRDLIPATLLAVTMGVLVYAVNFIYLPDIFKLVIQIILGIFSYTGLSYLFNIESFVYLKDILMRLVKKR